MDVVVDGMIRIAYPTEAVKQWCKSHLVFTNPEFIKKLNYGFWTGNTPEKLYLYEVHGDTWVLPFGVLRELRELIDFKSVKSGFAHPESVYYGYPLPLYDYQKEAVRVAVAAKYGILQSAAGSGKTTMMLELIRQYGRKTLWLTHTKDLLRQSKERAECYMPGDLLGTITGGRVNIGRGITFATVQTMSKLDLPRFKDEWDVIVVDECHRVSASASSVTMFQRVLNNLSARHKYGITATAHRSDGMFEATCAMLGKVIYTVPEEAIANKIMKVGVVPIGTGFRLDDDCLGPDGMLCYPKLINSMTENLERNRLIVDTIIQNREHSCLILSDRLNHLEALMNLLPEDMRNDAVMITGKMVGRRGEEEREQALEQMRTGDKKYLFASYGLCKEGLDIPRLERLFLTTPQKDYAVITQSIGRIARTHEGKADPIACDFVDGYVLFLQKMYKARLTIYRKNGCYFPE